MKFIVSALHHNHHQQHEQLDNNLPPYQSKLARLNVECADPSLLQDCVAGQKWKCINEDGRWRKHKCKFHREVQQHLAEVNKYLSAQSKRNCACFTPDGVVYTKIKSERDVFQPKQKRFEPKHRSHNGRHKRETAEFDEIYIDRIPIEFLDLLRMSEVVENLQNSLLNQSEHSRKKREVDYMTQTIDELNTVLGTIESRYANASNNPVQCFVEETGKVNCSTVIYENEQAWKQSRVQIDQLIRVLKTKIMNLKDIKKHLKENRPLNMTFDEEYFENSSLSVEDLERSEEVDKSTTAIRRRITKPTVSHPHRHQTGPERRKKTRIPSTTEAGSSQFTTENEEFYSSSVTEAVTIGEATTFLSIVSSSSIRPRNRSKIFRTSTTTTTFEPPVYEDDNSENTSVTELPVTLSTTEAVTDTFDIKSVTIDATIIEAKPRNRQTDNNVNLNVTTEHEQQHRNVPADCYCEPEHERFFKFWSS